MIDWTIDANSKKEFKCNVFDIWTGLIFKFVLKFEWIFALK